MTAISRGPTPPGPVTELFDRLDELHLVAGLPSMREIASRAGRGRISSSTVHNVFRSTRVPRWSFLEEIVKALQGDTTEFLALWRAAYQAEHDPGPPHETLPDTAPSAPGAGEPAPVRYRRIWSSEIPRRNLNFTGRVAELDVLRANLVSGGQPRPRAQVISGMGGVGKTEIATEYIHLHRDEYEIMWWIRAEHHDRVRDALVKLGQRLELRLAITGGGRDRAIAAVLEALESGIRPNWLLVYDNVAQPLDLQRYLPTGPPGGHIIITSRLQNWPGYVEADSIEVAPFTEEEAISFLRRRVPALGVGQNENERRVSDAGRLATALGHLPIAVEHAAAYLTETGQSVDDYLTRFDENAHGLLSEQPGEIPASVSATWTMFDRVADP